MTNIRHVVDGPLADQLVEVMASIDSYRREEKRRSPLSPRQRLLSLLRKDVERTDCMHFTKEP